MTYLMSQHRGQLRLIVQISQQSAVNIDIPTRSSKGVNVRTVDDSKGERAVGFATVGDQALTDAIDIGL